MADSIHPPHVARTHARACFPRRRPHRFAAPHCALLPRARTHLLLHTSAFCISLTPHTLHCTCFALLQSLLPCPYLPPTTACHHCSLFCLQSQAFSTPFSYQWEGLGSLPPIPCQTAGARSLHAPLPCRTAARALHAPAGRRRTWIKVPRWAIATCTCLVSQDPCCHVPALPLPCLPCLPCLVPYLDWSLWLPALACPALPALPHLALPATHLVPCPLGLLVSPYPYLPVSRVACHHPTPPCPLLPACRSVCLLLPAGLAPAHTLLHRPTHLCCLCPRNLPTPTGSPAFACLPCLLPSHLTMPTPFPIHFFIWIPIIWFETFNSIGLIHSLVYLFETFI